MDARPNVAPMNPKNFGLSFKGRRSTKMIMPPVEVPALAAPEMARPTMNAVDVGAAAQMMEPISKTTTVRMKVHLAGKKVCVGVQYA